ncbi:hypothetical protein RHGRI_037136 [Rhododendron griersonianum]|uniref:Uncharacterized protein n=1 Tax=Rhododendron griersonianum TaxID=479676 RepID=A0AAV6HR43_9ERIC|nr:hypothetical protein RHGRI_037136 [Rhododendron griersonianum]
MILRKTSGLLLKFFILFENLERSTSCLCHSPAVFSVGLFAAAAAFCSSVVAAAAFTELAGWFVVLMSILLYHWSCSVTASVTVFLIIRLLAYCFCYTVAGAFAGCCFAVQKMQSSIHSAAALCIF